MSVTRSVLLAMLVLFASGSFAQVSVVVPNASEFVAQGIGLNTLIRDNPNERVGQIYLHRSQLGPFASGGQITSMQFRLYNASTTFPTANVTFNQYDVQFSESDAASFAAGQLASTTFATNMGANVTMVRSGPLTILANELPAGNPAPFNFVMPFTTPYNYVGNTDIVVTIRHTGYLPNTVVVQFLCAVNSAPGFSSCITATGATATVGAAATATVLKLNGSIGPGLNVTATTGTRDLHAAGATGPGGNGIEAGRFTIASNNQTPAPALLTLSLKASGTGNDATDFTQVTIFRDGNANGTYEFASDVSVVTAATAFPSDDGTIVFTINTAEQGFAISETRTYFVVIRLAAGALPTRTYDFQVTALTTSGGTVSGTPSAVMEGVQIEAPTLTLTAQTGSVQSVFANEAGPGGNGLQVAQFSVACTGAGSAVLTAIVITPSGTGNDASDFSEVAIYREDGATPGYQSGADVLIDTYAAFPSDNGARTFNVAGAEQNFSVAGVASRTYYLVVKLAGTAAINSTFSFAVTDITVTNTFKAGTPGGAMQGLLILPPTFFFTDHSPTTPQIVYIGSTDVVLHAFSATYPNGANNNITSFNVRGLGNNGHEVNHITSVRLVRDVNADRLFDIGDSVIATGTYNLDNGQCTFNTSGQPQFVAPETRDYLIVYDFNNSAPDGAEFKCYINTANGQLAGTGTNGLPLPNTSGNAGVVINANRLTVTLVGPTVPLTVNHNETGTAGDGLLLANVTIQAPPNHAWTLTSLTFVASGTGNHAAAYSQVSVHQDNGNGTWNGAATDPLAAPTAASFNAVTNDVTFTLTTPALSAGATRRFLLVGRLNGTATTGQTFNARLDGMVATSALPGQINAVPTADSNALMIDLAVLAVASGPKPADVLRKAGTTAQLPMARFVFSATNNSVDVNSFTLTTGGTGDWINDFDAATGVQAWRDDGDGVFNSASDTLLAQAAGAAAVVLSPAPVLTVPNGGSVDVWIVVNVLATAGTGAAATPDTYTFGITGAGSVNATGAQTVAVSTAAPPTSSTLSIIDFFVSGFVPSSDVLAGGEVITMTGSGFMTPLTIRIDGVVCAGTPVISGGGTQVTGLIVPPRSAVGKNLPIEVTSGTLPAEVLTQTFTYAVKGSAKPADGGSGCVSGRARGWAALALAILLAGGASARRRYA